jgi:hypothetical protein
LSSLIVREKKTVFPRFSPLNCLQMFEKLFLITLEGKVFSYPKWRERKQ